MDFCNNLKLGMKRSEAFVLIGWLLVSYTQLHVSVRQVTILVANVASIVDTTGLRGVAGNHQQQHTTRPAQNPGTNLAQHPCSDPEKPIALGVQAR